MVTKAKYHKMTLVCDVMGGGVLKNVYVVLSTVRLFCTSEGVPSRKTKKNEEKANLLWANKHVSLFIF